MSPVYTSIDPTPDKALFKNQRVRKPKKSKKPEKEGKRGWNKPQRGTNR
jgi:hypothetical protein